MKLFLIAKESKNQMRINRGSIEKCIANLNIEEI